MRSKKLTTLFSINIAITIIVIAAVITLWSRELLQQTLRQKMLKEFDFHAKLMTSILNDESNRIQSVLKNIQVPRKVQKQLEQKKILQAKDDFLKSLSVDIWEELDILILISAKDEYWVNSSAPIPDTSSVVPSIVETAKTMRNEDKVLQIFDGENLFTIDISVHDYVLPSGRRGGKIVGGTVLNQNTTLLEKMRKIVGVSKLGITFKKNLIGNIGLSEKEKKLLLQYASSNSLMHEFKDDAGERYSILYKEYQVPNIKNEFGVAIFEKIDSVMQGPMLRNTILIGLLLVVLTTVNIFWVRKVLRRSREKLTRYIKALTSSSVVHEMESVGIVEFNQLAVAVKILASKMQSIRLESSRSHKQLNKIMKELNASRRELEEMVDEQTRKLKESVAMKELAQNANDAKSELLAVISHEFKTPLHAIISFSRYGIDDVEADDFDKDEIIKNFEEINDAGSLLLEFVNDLLDLSRLEAKVINYRMEQSDLLESVMSVTRSLSKLAASRNLEIIINYKGKSFEAIFDSRRIQQVVRNLLSNAIKFSHEGSVIEIDISKTLFNDIKSLQLSIKNTGVKISEGDLKKIFDSFYQADDSLKMNTSGTGLGLAICKRIVEDHEGKIFSTSSDEGITTFSIVIPQTGHASMT